MGTMMALRAHARGGPEQLVFEQAPIPAAGPGEALVAVHAAAITFAELTWDLSWTTRDGADRTPVIPSHEMSGVVAGLGDGVTSLAVGDEVIGLIDFASDGAAAEYVAVPAATLAGKPGRDDRRGPPAHGDQPDLPAGRGAARLPKRRAPAPAGQDSPGRPAVTAMSGTATVIGQRVAQPVGLPIVLPKSDIRSGIGTALTGN